MVIALLRQSIQARGIALSTLIAILLFGAMIANIYHDEAVDSERELSERMELQGDLLAASISQPMWDFNNKYIHTAALGALSSPDIDAVIVTDNKGKIIERLSEIDDAYMHDSMHFEVSSPIRYERGDQRENLGTVTLTVSREGTLSQLHTYLQELILEGMLFIICMLCLQYIKLRHLLRPITEITRTMLALAEGKIETEIPSQQQADEIGKMARAIQTFKNTAVNAEALMHEVEVRRAMQKELERAKEHADAANTAKSQFLANMSHEIRTPLNGIIGMAHLLQDMKLTAAQQEYINTINYSANNLLLLLNDILDISKIEAHELVLEHIRFDIRKSFLNTCNVLKPIAQKKNIEVMCSVEDGVPAKIKGDPGRISQIVTNLLGNAIKFTEQGKVEANLRFDPGASVITCEVQDTGIGIPEKKKPEVFKKFMQADASISRKYGGTGLGLAITKQLVEMMGGQIDFESTEGVGSRFWFTLPAEEAAEDALVAERPAVLRQRLKTKDARVLVAEDNHVNQMILVKLLDKYGFAVVDTAENGNIVLEKLAQSSYDAIFMDCQMPEKDGYETTAAIREQESKSKENKHIPIFAITADAMAKNRERCFRVGMDAYLSKPIAFERLQALINEWFICEECDAAPSQRLSAVPGTAAVNLERLRMVATSPEEEKELLRMFFQQSAEKLALLEKSRRSDEFPVWKSAAHYIKGMAANLGMEHLATLCRRAEKSGSATYEQSSQLLLDMRQELERIREFLAAK